MPISRNTQMDGALVMKGGCKMKKDVVYQTLHNCWRRQNLQNKYDTGKKGRGWEKDRESCYGLDNWRLSWENGVQPCFCFKAPEQRLSNHSKWGFWGLVSNCAFFPSPCAKDERPSPVCRAELSQWELYFKDGIVAWKLSLIYLFYIGLPSLALTCSQSMLPKKPAHGLIALPSYTGLKSDG